MIKLSRKWSYALKSVIYIAEKNPELIKILDISSDLKISESLLRRIISELDKSWILITSKGRSGWVQLGMEVKDISIYDILNSVWEELWISNCTKWLVCENIENCNTSNLFWSLQKSFNETDKELSQIKVKLESSIEAYEKVVEEYAGSKKRFDEIQEENNKFRTTNARLLMKLENEERFMQTLKDK
jgi:Rrf2 family protein